MTYGLSTVDEKNEVKISYVIRAGIYAACVMGSTYVVYLLYYELTGESICFVKWCLNKIPVFNAGIFAFYMLLEVPYLVMVSLCNRSISVNNGDRRDGKGMRSSVIASLLVSSSGLIVMLAIFLLNVVFNGKVLFSADRGYIFFTGLSGTLLYIAMCGLINCYITNKTNSIYAGTIAAAILSAWSLVGNFPLG